MLLCEIPNLEAEDPLRPLTSFSMFLISLELFSSALLSIPEVGGVMAFSVRVLELTSSRFFDSGLLGLPLSASDEGASPAMLGFFTA